MSLEHSARQNFAQECEARINQQINLELEASYAYLCFYAHFSLDSVALPGAAEFFRKESHEEREHAEKLIKYQTQRGGRVVFQDIAKPSQVAVASLQEAMQVALGMEKRVNQSLLDLHQLAGQHGDAALQDFIESEYLSEQVEAIKKYADYVSQTKRAGQGLGEYLFDKMSLHDN